MKKKYFLTILCVSVAMIFTACGQTVSSIKTTNSSGKIPMDASLSVTSTTSSIENTENLIDKIYIDMAKDIFDHLLQEDWDYFFEKYHFPENSIVEPSDIKTMHMSDNAMYYSAYYPEVSHKMKDRGYTFSEKDIVWSEDESGTRFILMGIRDQNDKITKRFGFIPIGEKQSDYQLMRSVDYGDECNICGYERPASESGFTGSYLVVPKEAKNITLRGVPIKEEWRDDGLFSFDNEEDKSEAEESSSYMNGEYKAYRVVIPQTTVYDNEYQIQDAERYLKEKNMDIGTVTPFVLSYETEEGTVHFNGLSNTWLSYNHGLSAREFYVAKI